MREDFLGILPILSNFFYIVSYLGLIVNVNYHFFQISLKLNSQKEQNRSRQKKLILVSFTYMRVDYFNG